MHHDLSKRLDSLQHHSAVLTNCLRVYYMYIPNGEYVNFDESETWTELHVMFAILCACLPVYSPLRSKITKVFIRLGGHDGSSWYSSSRKSSKSDNVVQLSSIRSNHGGGMYAITGYSRGRNAGNLEESTRDLIFDARERTHITVGRLSQDSRDNQLLPPRAISCTTRIEVV